MLLTRMRKNWPERGSTITLIGAFLLSLCCSRDVEKVSLKEESLKTLSVLSGALIQTQVPFRTEASRVTEASGGTEIHSGALYCESCGVHHSRAAEAVYPFAVMYKHTSDRRFFDAARNLGSWLIGQQQPDGSWKETPEEWTGTTTDQLLMMVMAFQILKGELGDGERVAWEESIRKAADFLTETMSPEFASINYCATTTASLAMTNRYFPDPRYSEKAGKLARQILAKMDEDGFIDAEGDRIYGIKYGADLGYEIDMSLWGLGLYARITGDKLVEEAVSSSLENHLYFVYPDGSIDGSSGIRSNKWTTYGSATADGCQILFSLFAGSDAAYRTAAVKNLYYLREMMRDGIIGYGPHYWEIFQERPCLYPTFVRAKNLAMTVEIGEQEAGEIPELPSDRTGWMKHFRTLDVVLLRSANFMATVSAYRYKSLKAKSGSKYMHRPSGGSISNLWVENHGFLQISSQTEYNRWEPMHFPEVTGMKCLTPRIEFENGNGYFTNLYEFDGRLAAVQGKGRAAGEISVSGELSDRNWLPGGVAYTWTHRVYNDAVEKEITLRYHGGNRDVKIIEPIVHHPGMAFEPEDSRKVRITGEKRTFRFEVLEGEVLLEQGKDASSYWSVYPSIRCYPIVLHVAAPDKGYVQKIRYRSRH